MASKSNAVTGSLPPVAPRRTAYNQRTSSADLNQNIRMASSARGSWTSNTTPTYIINNNNKVVVASAAISSKPIPIPSPAASSSQQPASLPAALSRSFSFESGGVRRKIPVTPAVSTGPRRHDTLHYRQGTLVFPMGIVGTLSLDLAGVVPGAKAQAARAAAVDTSILHFCQEANIAALKNYVIKRNGKVAADTLNLTDPSGKSGLMLAAMNGNVLVARELVHLQGIDINIADNEGNTALHLAAQAGHVDVLTLLTMSPSVLIDSRNDFGMTPLMKAAVQGRIRCTRLLLLAGASPTLRDTRRSKCALDWARYTSRTKCAEIIEKYMEKMQLNPGIGGMTALNASNRYTSEPNLKRALFGQSPPKSKESWVKSTIKKAIQVVSGNSKTNNIRTNVDDFNVASHLTNSVLNASMSGSLPVLPSSARQATEMMASTPTRTLHQPPVFVIPRIQVSFWNDSLGNIPPPPSGPAPKKLPQERNPAAIDHRHAHAHSSTATKMSTTSIRTHPSDGRPQAPIRSRITK